MYRRVLVLHILFTTAFYWLFHTNFIVVLGIVHTQSHVITVSFFDICIKYEVLVRH